MPCLSAARMSAPAIRWLAVGLALAAGGEMLSGARPTPVTAASAGSTPVVLELFTSQGCNSCPPADALLERFAKRSDVIALSLPVDYWDRLGWKDTFGSRQHSDRQRAYAAARGDGQVYTPQIVAGGLVHALGSSARDIEQAIGTVRGHGDMARVAVAVRVAGGEAIISVLPDAGNGAGAEVFVAAVQERGAVDIRRGENAGHTVTYHNVVRSLKRAGTFEGEAREFKVALDSIKATGATKLAVIVQRPAGAVLGAAMQPMVWSGG